MRFFMALGASLCMAMPLWAEDAALTKEQAQVVICLDNMGAGTEWGQCVGLLFTPCAEEDVGSAGHIACLNGLHDRWSASVEASRDGLLTELTPAGAGELRQLLEQWTGYVAQKCSNVASDKKPGFNEAAQLGCEVSEMAGIMSELVACQNRRSIAPYCAIQE